MTPEQIGQIIAFIILTLLGGVGGGAAISRRYGARNEQDQKSYREDFQDATLKIVKQQQRIDQLETDRTSLIKEVSEIKALVTVLTKERESERERADGYLLGQGRLEERLSQMQIELDSVKRDQADLREENKELQADKRRLEELLSGRFNTSGL